MNKGSGTDSFEGAGLACRRGGRLVFAGLDFRLAPGGLLVLKGANGSGKSSLLRMASGLLTPERGTLRRAGGVIAGERVDDDPAAHQADLHYVGHKNAIKSGFSVRANLDFWARFAGGTSTEAALDAVGLAPLAELRAGELSAGQQRRVALARLFLRPVGLWLLDEPTVGLDHTNRDRLAAAMNAHLDRGGMIMAATHVDLGIPGDVLDLDDFGPAPLTIDEAEATW